jgi:hypothetical protein
MIKQLIFLLFLLFYSCKTTKHINISPSKFDVNLNGDIIQKSLNIPKRSNQKLVLSLKSGTYHVSKILVISQPNTTIRFSPNSKIVFTSEENCGILMLADNCTIENGYFKGNGISSKNFYKGCGVFLSGVDHCKVKNCTFSDISGNNIILLPNSKDKGCSFNLIEGNQIRNPKFNLESGSDAAGILLGYSGRGYSHNFNIIKNNFIDGNNTLDLGIGIIGHGKGNLISNNKIMNLRSYGIISYVSKYAIESLSRTIIKNNEVKNIGEKYPDKTRKGMGIYVMGTYNAQILKNKVTNTLISRDKNETIGSGSISVSLSPFSLIDGNEINHSAMYGITSAYSFHSNFVNNKIKNVAKSGMYFVSMSDVLIENNILDSIGDSLFKGYFDDTSKPYIKEQGLAKIFQVKETGRNFIIRKNTLKTDNFLIDFKLVEDSDSSKILTDSNAKPNVFEYNTLKRTSVSKVEEISDLFIVNTKKRHFNLNRNKILVNKN